LPAFASCNDSTLGKIKVKLMGYNILVVVVVGASCIAKQGKRRRRKSNVVYIHTYDSCFELFFAEYLFILLNEIKSVFN
jgi:hypothetical protein